MRAPDEPALVEAECLAALMRFRFGAAPCRACGSNSGFQAEARNRAFSCRSCGMKVFPCQGTPFARPRPPLTDWFRAVDLAARGEIGARLLRRRLGLDRAAAAEMAAAIARLRSAAPPDPAAGWFEKIASFVAEGRAAAPIRAAINVAGPERETLWESLRALMPIAQFERRPILGLVAIGLFMLAGAGVGWLLVPETPEPDAELAQATAILSLGEKKPVILVNAEIGAQLYDVTDVDADPNSPLASTIRIAPKLDPSHAAALTSIPSIAPPSVKLSGGAGQSLVDGNIDAVKASARDRPELAAYGALANELEGKGPRNPDELLSFGPMRIRRYLVEKIVRASRATNVDPVLLMAIADKESSFKTEVQAQTSSASGLYQFIERTWLGVVRDFGPRYGLGKEAALLGAGDLASAERQRILGLRNDPYLSAVFAAEMLKRDSLRIAKRIGRNLTGGEVYLVHFLGPDGAERMIDEITRKPDTIAADLLPKPAAANKPIFYGANAKSLSVSEVRGKFEIMISLRLDRYRSVKAVNVSNAPEAQPLPIADGR